MSNTPMTLPHLMIAEHETVCGHESTFVELDDGRVLHYAGCWVTTWRNDGVTWLPLTGQVKDITGNDAGGVEYSLVHLSEKSSIGLAARFHDEPIDATWPMPPHSL